MALYTECIIAAVLPMCHVAVVKLTGHQGNMSLLSIKSLHHLGSEAFFSEQVKKECQGELANPSLNE